jgi:hypothetical protein
MINKQKGYAMGAEDKNLRDKIISKAWKDPVFKKKLQTDPATALKEMGYELPKNVKVRFMEDNANAMTFVLPAPPQNITEMSEGDLERLAAGAGITGWTCPACTPGPDCTA